MANDVAKQQAARKQVTVLFCDVVDYTIRSNSMDPEDLADEIRVFQSICSRISEKYHGTISNFLGDGVLVLFGHPYASEFNPNHAVKASLEIIDEIEQNNFSYEWRFRHPISVRMGIATSLVVVGEKAGKNRDQDELIYGEAPNLAARLQALAEPNTVVISLRTRRLVGARFKFQNLGNHSIKGFKQPISAWRLLNESSLLNRTYSSLRRVTTRFVSRHKELSFLTDHYAIATNGKPQFVHLVGEAGVGKSRLIRVFEKTLKSQDIHRIRISCSPYYQTTTLKSVLDQVCRWIQVNLEDEPRIINTQIRKALSEMGMLTEEAVALFFETLSIPPPNDIDLLRTNTEDKHLRTICFLASLVYQLSTTKLVMVVIEDLHWADPTTLELLNHLIENGSRRPIFAISSSRPEHLSNIEETDSSIVLHLEGLDKNSSADLVHSLFENIPIPLEVEEAIVQKSDGMPLYLEECSWQILNQIQSQPNLDPTDQSLSIPDSLQDSLNARLDQLGAARELAQLAATFGSHFTFSKIRIFADLNGIDADSGMDIMMQAGLLRVILSHKEDQYIFNHALIQEAAYKSLLRKTRQLYHQQLVELYIQDDPDVLDTQPGLIAYHYSRTNNLDAAIALWLKAAKLAINQSSIAEAMDHIDRGRKLLKELPESNRGLKYELEYLLNLAVCHTVKSGYIGEQVEQTYQKCIDIADLVGNLEQQWSALYGFWRCLVCRGEFGKSLEISVRLKRLSDSLNDRTLRMTSLGIQAMTRLFAGKFQSSETFFESSIENYDQIEDKNIGIQFGQDPYVTSQGLYAVNKLICNDLVQSKREIEKSVTIARSIGHPYTIAETLRLAAMYEQIRRDMKPMRKFTSEAITLSDEYGFDGLLATSKIFMAFCDVVTYRSNDAIEVIKFELTQYKENYGLLFLPYFQGLLAEAYLYMNQYQEAFTESTHVLLLIEKYGEVWPKVPVLLTRAEAAARGMLAEESQIQQWYLESETLALTQKSKLFMKRVEDSRKKFEKAYSRLAVNSDATDELNLYSFSENTYKLN